MNGKPTEILLVEDERAHAAAINRAFENMGEKVNISIAGTLAEFRKQADDIPPDIAVMDLNLPDGRAVDALTNPPEAGRFPILLMTSYGNEHMAVEAIKAGALDYIVKSVEAFVEMPRIVERAMREWNLLQERKRAEEELRRANAYNRMLIEVSLDPFVTIGMDGKITDVNMATEEVTGAPRQELIGSDFSDYFTDPEAARYGYKKVFEDGSVRDYPMEIRHRDGHTTPVLYNASIYPDENGNIIGVFAAARNITERKHLEEQLLQSQKMEAVGQLAGGVAHDLNNILTVIYGYCSVLQMKIDVGAPFRSDIDHIYAAAERAANLTRSLLAFSRKQIMSPKTVNLNDVITNVVKLLSRIIGEDIEINTVFTANPLNIFADRGQIEQILMNLAANARDAMPDGGKLTIETKFEDIDEVFIQSHGYGTAGEYIVISVSDTGKGMDAETANKIFEPFFTTKDVGQGTGLGLSIVYGVVKQHNGYIDVFSEQGEGTIFNIYLPRVYEEGADDIVEKKPDYPLKGSETLLVAEDDPSIRAFADLILRKYGYEVILARDGADAVEKFKANSDKIDIIIMDMIMPGKGGKEAYEEIRKVRPDVKVLFMSGYSPDILLNKGFLNTGEEVLIKPVQPLELIRKVRAALDG